MLLAYVGYLNAKRTPFFQLAFPVNRTYLKDTDPEEMWTWELQKLTDVGDGSTSQVSCGEWVGSPIPVPAGTVASLTAQSKCPSLTYTCISDVLIGFFRSRIELNFTKILEFELNRFIADSTRLDYESKITFLWPKWVNTYCFCCFRPKKFGSKFKNQG